MRGALTRWRRATPRCSGLAALIGLLAGPPALAAGAPEPGAPAASAPQAEPAVLAPLFAPGTLALADWQLTPTLLLAWGQNSNLRLQSAGVLSSHFTALMPSLTAARSVGEERYQLGWRSEWTRFDRSPIDSTLNSELSAEGLNLLGAQTALAWRLAWQDWHDSVGQADPDLPADAPDRFRALALGAVWRHDGVQDGALRLELEPTLSSRRYLNHRERTAHVDADTLGVVARALARVTPEQFVGSELRLQRNRYVQTASALGNVDARVLLSAQWTGPAAWTGGLKLGLQQRSFTAWRDPYQGSTWEAELHWQPAASDQLDFSTSRGANDAPGEGADEVVARRHVLAWTHHWSARWRASLTASKARSTYVSALFPRDDQLRSLDLAIRHDLGPRWQLGVNLGWFRRYSSEPGFEFQRHLRSVVLTAAI